MIGTSVEAVVGDALVPGLQPDPQLLPGEVRAEAAVRPGAEGDVPVGLAVDDHLVGVGELAPGRGWPTPAAGRPSAPAFTGQPATSMSCMTLRPGETNA